MSLMDEFQTSDLDCEDVESCIGIMKLRGCQILHVYGVEFTLVHMFVFGNDVIIYHFRGVDEIFGVAWNEGSIECPRLNICMGEASRLPSSVMPAYLFVKTYQTSKCTLCVYCRLSFTTGHFAFSCKCAYYGN